MHIRYLDYEAYIQASVSFEYGPPIAILLALLSAHFVDVYLPFGLRQTFARYVKHLFLRNSHLSSFNPPCISALIQCLFQDTCQTTSVIMLFAINSSPLAVGLAWIVSVFCQTVLSVAVLLLMHFRFIRIATLISAMQRDPKPASCLSANSPNRTRTCNLPVNSRLLYH